MVRFLVFEKLHVRRNNNNSYVQEIGFLGVRRRYFFLLFIYSHKQFFLRLAVNNIRPGKMS